MALDVEGVVNGGVRGKKSLCRTPAFEALHLAFPSSGWLMRVLSPVVTPSARLMALHYLKVTSSRSI